MPKLLKLWYQNLSVKQKQQLAYTTTSHHLQTLLASDVDPDVRSNVANNPSLLPDVQKILAKDKKSNIRRWLADKPSLTSAVQEILARDTDSDVRYWLAKNPSLTKEAKKLLKKYNK